MQSIMLEGANSSVQASAWQGINGAAKIAPSGNGVNSTIIRPADVLPYIAGDVQGLSVASTAAMILPTNVDHLGGLLSIMDVELMIQLAAIPVGMTSFALELYSATPPSALADNAPWTLTSNDWPYYLGYIEIGTPVVRGGCLYVQNIALNKTVLLTSSNLYYYLKTNGGYTPISASVALLNIRAVSI